VSMAGLACYQPGARARWFYRARVHRGRKGERRSMSEADYAELVTAAHRQLHGPHRRIPGPDRPHPRTRTAVDLSLSTSVAVFAVLRVSVAAVQPSLADSSRAHRSTACTSSDSSSARHSNDHG
jgi:hypothetical protein